MADAFLLPEDVSAEHARQVLDFINQAPSAQVIAEAVELPGELDVGVRIGQRIINRRTELGGFRTLDQLYAVPYIGPERFTEIVVSLSGARPPRAAIGVAESELADLRRSVDALRAMLQPAVQARLWSVQDTIWLGQNASVLVQVNEINGRPLVDQPVTITTTWGELSARSGLQTLVGNAVVTRTDDVGLAELRLRLRFQAPISDAQRLALELAAGELPLTAPWPTAASKELSGLVQRYRAPGSDALREAVDAAFREYATSVEETEHRGQALAQWGLVPVSLVCFVNDEADERGQRHLALATHTLMVRNWLPAFLATFEEDVARDKRLAAELRRAPRDIADANEFLNDVFVSVQSFLNTELGEIGHTIRHRAAQRELQQFLQTDVAGLPEDARLDALTGVRDASRTIGEGGLTMFTAVEVNRRAITASIDFTAAVFGNRLDALERTAVTAQQFDDLRTQILEDMRAEVTGIRDSQATLETQIRQVADSQAELSQQINLKADRNTLDALTLETARLTRDLDALNAGTSGLRTDLNGLSSSFNGLNRQMTRDLATVGTRLDDIDARLPRR